MKQSQIIRVALCLITSLILSACESVSQYETEATVPASTRSTTRVVKDEIPAEGQRKIPVVEQY